jgi:phage shock protein C
MVENRLLRNQHDKMIAGVASGIAEHLKIDTVWVRLGFVMAVFAGFSGVLAYIILWIAIPARRFPYLPSSLDVDYRVYDPNDPLANKARYPPYPEPARKDSNGRMIAGIALIFVGLVFLSDELDFLPYWISFDKLWPLALIIPGIMILMKAGKKEPVYETQQEEVENKEESTPSDSINNTDSTL